jgi:hypothetical protein
MNYGRGRARASIRRMSVLRDEQRPLRARGGRLGVLVTAKARLASL